MSCLSPASKVQTQSNAAVTQEAGALPIYTVVWRTTYISVDDGPLCIQLMMILSSQNPGFSPAWALGRSARFSNLSAQSARLGVVTFCLVSLPMRLYLVSCGL